MLSIPEGYKGSVCEVKTLKNKLLTTGSVDEIGETSIKLANPGDSIDIITYKTKVKVGIFNSQLGFKVVIGSVYISTKEFLLIEDVQSITEFEKREFFRMDVKIPGRLIESSEESLDAVKFEDVLVENISLGGILFSVDSAKKVFENGGKLFLGIDFPQGRDVFQCTVCRIIKDDLPLIRYGCRFDNCSSRQEDLLWRFILSKQQEEIRKARLKKI